MRNQSEVALLNGCMYMLQVHQIVSSSGQHYSWLTLNTVFTVISLSLTCFVMYSIFRTGQFVRSPFMIIFIYACLNDLLFAFVGQLKYSTICLGIELPCYVYVIFYFFTEFTHLQAVNLLLLIAYARYIYAKHFTDVKSRITSRSVHIAAMVTTLYAIIISFAPIIPFIVERYRIYMVAKLLNSVFMALAIATIFLCYLKGLKHILLRMGNRQVQRNLTVAGQKYFVSMLTIISMILLLHVPYTLSTIIETTFVYTGNYNIPLWCKYYPVRYSAYRNYIRRDI